MAEFSRPLRLAEIPVEGLSLELDATADECAAVVRRLGLLSLGRLHGQLSIKPIARGGLALTGTLQADVEQSCVVTMEALPSEVSRPLNLRFLNEEAFRQYESLQEDPLDGPDVEPMPDEILDLGELLVEELSLAVDPYPRREDASIARADLGSDGVSDSAEDKAPSPFAVLEGLAGKTR